MKCQSLFSGINIINLLSAEFAQRMVKVKGFVYIQFCTASINSLTIVFPIILLPLLAENLIKMCGGSFSVPVLAVRTLLTFSAAFM